DQEIMEALQHWARTEGVFAAPEGAAALVAYRKLLAGGFFKPSDTVILYNTGSGLKYVDVIAQHTEKDTARPAARQIGGSIGPDEVMIENPRQVKRTLQID